MKKPKSSLLTKRISLDLSTKTYDNSSAIYIFRIAAFGLFPLNRLGLIAYVLNQKEDMPENEFTQLS